MSRQAPWRESSEGEGRELSLKERLLWVIIPALALAGCAPRMPSWSPLYRGPAPHYQNVHFVQRGETLSSIARRYDVSVESLVRYNALRDPNRIEVGQRLRIPPKDAIARLYKLPPARPRPKPPKSTTALAEPFLWPVSGTITKQFSEDANDPHKGIDIAAPEGTPIRSADGGTVLFSGVGPEGYGLIVIVRHDSRFVTVYAHNRANLVKAGQSVERGQHIAYVGTSGNSTGPHLHFEVRREADPQDPITVLPSKKR